MGANPYRKTSNINKYESNIHNDNNPPRTKCIFNWSQGQPCLHEKILVRKRINCKNCSHQIGMIRKKGSYPMHIQHYEDFRGKIYSYPTKLCSECQCDKPEMIEC